MIALQCIYPLFFFFVFGYIIPISFIMVVRVAGERPE